MNMGRRMLTSNPNGLATPLARRLPSRCVPTGCAVCPFGGVSGEMFRGETYTTLVYFIITGELFTPSSLYQSIDRSVGRSVSIYLSI